VIESRSVRHAIIAAVAMIFINGAHARTGVIVAWGNNNVGQSTFNGSDTAIDIAVCGEQWSGSTFWVKPDGTIGSRGQFGGMPPQNLGNCVQVAAGYRHGLALKLDGGVVGWGESGYGTGGLEAAYKIPGALGACTQIAAGGNNSAALTAGGLPEVWGAFGASPAGVGVCKQVAVGTGTLAVLKVNGSVAVPFDSGNFGTSQVPQSLGSCTAIAAGDFHVLAIQESGTVVAWGMNWAGQCGTTEEQVGGSASWTTDSRYGAYWVKTSLGPCKGVSAASQPADYWYSGSAVIRVDGSVLVWGGRNSRTPTSPDPNPGACTKVSIGAAHVAAIQVPLPSILGVMPISGPAVGGTAITITGTDFFPYSTVLIGGAPATDVVVVSPTKITAVTPAGFPGPTEVKVNLGSAIAFYYRPECGADLDQNGEVDGADLSILLLEWGPCYRGLQASGTQSQDPPELLAAEPAPKPVTAK
jgi:alpha-tubulin suppressor-like RCC1 family protein